jgi:4-hydroxyphenylpyruvate dioxygenase
MFTTSTVKKSTAIVLVQFIKFDYHTTVPTILSYPKYHYTRLNLAFPTEMPYKPAIPSMSLGRAWAHELPDKLSQAASYGFEGVELFFEDIEYSASRRAGGLTQANIITAAGEIKQLCDKHSLVIIALQPFWFYEGLLDRVEHNRLLTEKLPLWFEIGRILDTDTILIPSNFLPPDPNTGLARTTGDRKVIVSDLRQIADLGLQQSPPFRFAYESLAWGTHINTWEECWDVVCGVDRPNLGICLDTFNIAARVYADPACPTGKTPNAMSDLQNSISRLLTTVEIDKVFLVQVVDGERLAAPLLKGHEWYVEEQPSRMSWSRNARLFPFEQELGGYLPVVDIAKAIFDLGFEGWVSMELFSRTTTDSDPRTPEEHAKRGMRSWQKLVQELELKC